jgi:hypothetical protein
MTQDTPRDAGGLSQFSQQADLSEGDEMRLLVLADAAARSGGANRSIARIFDSLVCSD